MKNSLPFSEPADSIEPQAPNWTILRSIAWEATALGALLQDRDSSSVWSNEAEVTLGIGTMMSRIGTELRTLAIQLEHYEMLKQKSDFSAPLSSNS